MNVALFASAFYPHVGGVEELVRQLAHEYRHQGMGAVVLTNRWPRSLPRYEEYEGVPVYRLAMRVPEGSWKARLNYWMTWNGIRREVLNVLRKHDIDLLHVQCVSANGYYALLAKQALGLPLVVTAQGERTMDATGLYQRSWFMNQVLRRLLTEAEAVTACSQHTLDDIGGYFGKPLGTRGRVVYNGIRTADFEEGVPFSHPRPYILGIGRLVPQKGFDLLIKAFAQAKPDRYDLLITGEGTERESLEALTKRLGIERRVQFMGRADRPTTVALFRGCDFFVLPSRQEPFGIVNLEAMAAGKAVIASRVGGVPEIVIDGETGLLVPGGDIGALSAAIAHLTADAALRQRMGMAALSRVRDFTWSAIANQYIDIYNHVHDGTDMPKAADFMKRQVL